VEIPGNHFTIMMDHAGTTADAVLELIEIEATKSYATGGDG
jgi:hypothetical protein